MKKTFTEEELEEADEDQQEEQLQPQDYGAKKRGAEAQPHPQRDLDDAAANSDEDLPEVFTMTEGKSIAQQLRNEEKASGRRIAAEVKRKKQERAASRKNEKISANLGTSPLKKVKAGEDDTDPAQANMNGLLDDTVVQFLSAREKAELDEVNVDSCPPDDVVKVKRLKSKKENSNGRVLIILSCSRAELDEVNVDSCPPDDVVKVKRLKSNKENSNGRVQVINLSRDLSFVEGRNAFEFKHGHLYGNRIKRDPSMLRNLARVP